MRGLPARRGAPILPYPTIFGASAVPLNSAVELAWKPVPVRVMVVSGLPTVAAAGLMLANVGTGTLMVNVCCADVPPPGVATVIDAAPAVSRAPAGVTASKWAHL